MEILTPDLLQEWVRIDPGFDTSTLDMLEASAIAVIASYTGLRLLPFTDIVTGITYPAIDPIPQAIKHAIAVYIHAHYDNRTGNPADAMAAIKAIVAPYWTPHL